MGLPFPAPIDPSYRPASKITTVAATAPIDEILAILERDGGVILEGLVSGSELDSINEELSAYAQPKERSKLDDGFPLIPTATTLIPGLVGKSKTIASICEKDVLEALRQNILLERFMINREGYKEENTIDPLLSLSICMSIGYGAPRQLLHRDDGIHATRHRTNKIFEVSKAGQFGCLVAGCDVTRENGATMFVPGSHKWGDDCHATADQITFAEMSKGSALIFLGSAWHGGGHNSVPNSQRTMYSLFFVRGNMRTEENQFLAVPRSVALGMSPKMLELLGYKKPTPPLGTVNNMNPVNDLNAIWEAAMA